MGGRRSRRLFPVLPILPILPILPVLLFTMKNPFIPVKQIPGASESRFFSVWRLALIIPWSLGKGGERGRISGVCSWGWRPRLLFPRAHGARNPRSRGETRSFTRQDSQSRENGPKVRFHKSLGRQPQVVRRPRHPGPKARFIHGSNRGTGNINLGGTALQAWRVGGGGKRPSHLLKHGIALCEQGGCTRISKAMT